MQLRMKDVMQMEYLDTAIKAREICHRNKAQLIINDSISVAKASGADGVHLGKEDAMITEARKVLGSNKMVGGTANTLADCQQLIQQGVNYIGLGPHRFTLTKEKLSPVLGFEGYASILNELQTTLPVYAIGGIQPNDVEELVQTGVHGVAISGALSKGNIDEVKATVALFEEKLGL